MNAPVTTAVPGIRPAAPRASDAGRAHSAAPFASALDGVLAENRASDRGIERRGSREERDDRAADRAVAEDRRAEDRAGAGPNATPPADEDAAREVPVPDVGWEVGNRETGTAAEPPRGGLPALWALVMGGSLATPGLTGEVPAAAGPVPAESVPALDPAAIGTVAPAATVPVSPVAPTAPDLTVDAATGAAVPASVGAAPASEAAGQHAAVPPLVAGSAPVPAVPATSSGAPASALPFDVVLEGGAGSGSGAAAEGTAPAVQGLPVTPAPSTPAAPAAAQTSAVGTAADALGVAALAPSGESQPDGAGQDSGQGGSPAGTGTTAQVTAGSAAVAVSSAPAVGDADGATGTAASLPVGSQVARQVAVLRGGPDGTHSMTLVLTPETLGPVEVQVTVTKGSVELALRGAHEQGRAALLDGLPDLRRDLEAAGLSCSRLEVDRETGGSWAERQSAQQEGFAGRSGQHDRGDNRSRPWGRPADTGGSGPSTIPNRSTSSGVDVLV